MTDILDVQEPVEFNEDVRGIELHTYTPFTPATLNYSDEVRIAINNQDLYYLVSESFILVEGKISKADGNASAATTKLVDNGVLHLFEEIRFLLANKEIDKVRNPGILTTIKNYLLLNKLESDYMQMSGWDDPMNKIVKDGTFSALIPLKNVLPFAEDYKKVVVNAKIELVLLRARNDNDALKTAEADKTDKVTVKKINWLVPHVLPSDTERLKFLDIVQKDQPIEIAFRQWDLYENALNQNVKDTWTVLTAPGLEKPRFGTFSIQTDRKGDITKDSSLFDNGNIQEAYLYCNQIKTPYGSLNSDFPKKQCVQQYSNYARFGPSFRNDHAIEPLLSYTKFKDDAPIFVFDCSQSNETLKSGPVDVRLEWSTNGTAMPANSVAYCIIVHDKLIQYYLLSNTVKTIV